MRFSKDTKTDFCYYLFSFRYIEVYVSSHFQLQRRSPMMGSFDDSYSDILLNSTGKKRRNYSPYFGTRREDRRFRIKLRGLPYTTCKREIALFFYDYGIEERDVVFLDVGYRRTGEAFVYFQSGEKARRAVREKHNKYIGDRYIELFEDF